MKYIVQIADKYRNSNKTSEILGWLLENCEGRSNELYKHWTPMDGKWRSGPETLIAAVEFENEMDAAAFKLKYT